MTEQTQPTDAELEALAVEHEAFGFGRADKQGLSTHGFDPDGLRDFARAVLAKWGTPAGAGEFVGKAMSLPGASGFTMACFHSDVVPLGAKLYTTPQPTKAQAGAVPLTVQYPEGYGNPFAKIAYDAGWRAAEHAHGIKGADHGKS